jgi:hypothetical protein
MTTESRRKWWTLAFSSYAVIGMSVGLALALLFGILAAADYMRGDAQAGLLGVWSSMAFSIVALAGLPALILGIRILWVGRRDPERRMSHAWLYAAVAYPLGLALGFWIYDKHGGPQLMGTFAQILSLGGPILAMGVLVQLLGESISSLRAWGHFLLGLWLIPTLSFVIELTLLVVGMTIVLGGLILSPAGQQLLNQLQGPPSRLFSQPPPELVTQAVSQPWVIALAIIFLSLLIPMVEEGLKSIAVWPILPRSPSPSQAFVGGALGGLGFALVEGMFLTQPDATWFPTAFVRGGASMMHALGAGLTAWGLAEAFVRRRFWRLPLAYACAVALHGLWNLSAVSLGVAQLSSQVGVSPVPPGLESLLSLIGGVMLGSLSLLAACGLPLIAHRLASQSQDEDEPLVATTGVVE